MTDSTDSTDAQTRSGISAAEYQQLRHAAADQDRRLAALEGTVVHAGVGLTVATLFTGLVMPFFVPTSSGRDSANLWQALSTKDTPRIVQDPGAFWWIPIIATLVVMVVAISLWSGAEQGRKLAVRRVLAWAYLVGCLLGFAYLGSENHEHPITVASPALIVLLIGGGLLAALTTTPLLSRIAGRPRGW